MNGVQDAGEAGIPASPSSCSTAPVRWLPPPTRRQHLFSKLAAGDRKIQVVTPNGYAITGKDAGGNDATDSDIDATGTTGVYT